MIREAGETSKPSPDLLRGGGNLLCPSPGAALQGSSMPCPALNSVRVAHVAKDLLAPLLCLHMCLSQRPLFESKGPLVEKLQLCLFSLEINMRTQPGWGGGMGGIQLHPAASCCACGSGEQSGCSVGHSQRRQLSISARGPPR